MSEPVYLPRTAYQSIAEVLSPHDIHAGIDAAMEAHRTIAAGFIKDEQLTPRQLEYVKALRNWLKHGRVFEEEPRNVEVPSYIFENSPPQTVEPVTIPPYARYKMFPSLEIPVSPEMADEAVAALSPLAASLDAEVETAIGTRIASYTPLAPAEVPAVSAAEEVPPAPKPERPSVLKSVLRGRKKS